MKGHDLIALVPVTVTGCLILTALYFHSKGKKRTPQEQALLDMVLKPLKDATSVDEVISLYEKSKLYDKKLKEDLLEKIILKLIKMRAFPRGVLEWLQPPLDAWDECAFNAVMEEFIAMRSGKLKDDIAIEAFCDGFISAKEALMLTDERKYPKTVATVLADPEDYDRIRRVLEKEKKLRTVL